MTTGAAARLPVDVLAGSAAVVPADLEVLAAAYDVQVGVTGQVDVAGRAAVAHAVLAGPPEPGRLAVLASAEHLRSVAVVMAGGTGWGPSAARDLAGLGVPTLVVAPDDGATRGPAQELVAAIPDAVFVLTAAAEDAAGRPATTAVQWCASFFSIVDGLHR